MKRVKHFGSEEETSEGASNGAVVASLGRLVGGHARVGASESGSDSESSEWSTLGERRGDDGRREWRWSVGRHSGVRVREGRKGGGGERVARVEDVVEQRGPWHTKRS